MIDRFIACLDTRKNFKNLCDRIKEQDREVVKACCSMYHFWLWRDGREESVGYIKKRVNEEGSIYFEAFNIYKKEVEKIINERSTKTQFRKKSDGN